MTKYLPVQKHILMIEGATGIGKTTALYWLYHQLVNKSEYLVIAIPFQSTIKPNFVDNIKSQTKNCGEKKIILLVDLLSIFKFPRDSHLLFEVFASIKSYKVVIAQSSSFYLFTSLQARNAKDFYTFFLASKCITFKPMEKGESKQFLKHMGVAENNPTALDQFVEYCNGILGLLTCCTKSNYKKAIELKEHAEFHTVVEYLIQHKLVNWSLEMKILVAANLKISVKNMGLDIEDIKQSYMLISHLIYIDDEGLPIPHFPGTGQCLVTNIRLIFGNLKTMNMQTDHNSVLGHIFESKVLILMTETKELKWTILPLFGDQTNQDSATFKVPPYSWTNHRY